jgi:hypothetical protein
MLWFFVKIVYIQTIFLSPGIYEENQILTKFISEFKNDSIIENWMNARFITRLDASDIQSVKYQTHIFLSPCLNILKTA